MAARAGVEPGVQLELDGLERAQDGAHRAGDARAAAGVELGIKLALLLWGATRYFERGWHVSAGYIYSQNSVPSANFTLLVPDTDRHAWSVGFGRQWGAWSADAGYQFTWGTPRVVSGRAV